VISLKSEDKAPFERELARFLLLGYAAGDRIVGDWPLRESDPVVPDVDVVIERVNGTDGPIARERATYTPEPEASFRKRLKVFVLTRFSQGYDVEGTWRVRFARMDLPEWDVQIFLDAGEEIDRRKAGISSIDN
jgi:hypothetical protein